MRSAGYLMITAGFLLGTLAAVQTPENLVELKWYGPALVLGIVGVVLARTAARGGARAKETVTQNLSVLHESLARIVDNAERLDAEKANLDPYEVHRRIDELFREDLTLFADARETIGHAYGLSSFAAVMNEFAAGERYLNRVWSSSIDGWIDEVQLYLGRARDQFRIALETLTAVADRDK